MISTFSEVAWLLLCVCTGVTASNVSPAATPSLCAGKPVMEKLDRLEHLLKSPWQTPQLDRLERLLKSPRQALQCPCSSAGLGSGTDGLSLTNKMSVLEAKMEATGVHLEAMKSKLEATQTQLEATQTKQAATQANLEATQANLVTTQASLEATQANLESTQRKLETAEAKLNASDTELQSTRELFQSKMKGGSTFVRWGRKSCTNASELVYSGVAGGSHFTHTGGAANMLCLTMKPQSEHITVPEHNTVLYGAEYEHIPNHHDHDAPCSVCRAPQHATIMIPATRSCPTGWTTQYTGHLVAGHHGHQAATEYVCLDGDPEDMSGGHKGQNGHLLYYTFTQCGSLPCPPYSHNAVVLCVVCSK